RRLGLFGHDTGDSGARDLDFDVFGDLQVDNFGLNTLNRPVNPAGCENSVAFFQRTEHFLRLFALFVRRTDHQKVKNGADGDDRQELEEGGTRAAGGTLEQSYRIHSFSSCVSRDRNPSRNAANESSAID